MKSITPFCFGVIALLQKKGAFMEPEKRNVFMCLDVKKYSFTNSTNVTSFGTILVMFFSVGYWALAFSFLQMFMMILDTLSKVKPMIIYTVVYLLIVQKLIRVFVIKEKERLAEFMEQSRNNIATLGDFYDIKSSGYEKQERPHPRTGKPQEFHKIKFRDGTDEYAVKFSRGSITSEYADLESVQIKTLCNVINTLMCQSIIPRVILSDERIERSVTFKFYQHKLKEGDFDPEFIDLCNSTILYHEQVAENYSRIPATYLFIPARTAKQKLFTSNFIKSVGNNIKFSSFRDVSPMNKLQILNMYKDLNFLNSINERELQTEEANRKVPLGLTQSLYLRNVITDEIITINESDIKFQLDIKGIQYDLRRKVETQENSAPKPIIEDDKTLVETDVDLFADLELPDIDLLEGEMVIAEESPVSETDIQLDEGVFNFRESVNKGEEVDKFILLLNNIQNEDCDTIVL